MGKMDNDKRICKTCQWHSYEEFSMGWVCVNDKSEHCADWTDDDYCCEFWEAIDK